MKKLALLLASSGLALAACTSDTEPDTETETVEDAGSAQDAMTGTDETDEAEPTEEEGGVNVDKGLFDVEVTIPSAFFEGEDPEQVAADADNAEEATVNDDGSITYKMTKAQHEEMMQDVATSVEDTTATITESGDYPSIQSIDTTDNYDRFTVQVDREAYEDSFDGFATMTLGVIGSLYQLFNGEDPDSYEVIIELEDAESGEVFNTITYPDALEEMGEA